MSERFLRLLLRFLGTVSLLALFAVVMPWSWMDVIHRQLGLGPLPSGPIVGYLARSLSAFYALFGALLWVLSFDLTRFRPVIRWLGWFMVVFGAILLGVDLAEGLPGYWTWMEAPAVWFYAVLILWLSGRAGQPPGAGSQIE